MMKYDYVTDTKLRGWANAMEMSIMELCPSSRERSLALTKLEETIFWAHTAWMKTEQES